MSKRQLFNKYYLIYMILFTVFSPHFFCLTSCSPLLLYDMKFKDTLHYHRHQWKEIGLSLIKIVKPTLQ